MSSSIIENHIDDAEENARHLLCKVQSQEIGSNENEKCGKMTKLNFGIDAILKSNKKNVEKIVIESENDDGNVTGCTSCFRATKNKDKEDKAIFPEKISVPSTFENYDCGSLLVPSQASVSRPSYYNISSIDSPSIDQWKVKPMRDRFITNQAISDPRSICSHHFSGRRCEQRHSGWISSPFFDPGSILSPCPSSTFINLNGPVISHSGTRSAVNHCRGSSSTLYLGSRLNGNGNSLNNNATSASHSRRKRSWSRAVFSNLQRKGLEKRFQLQKYITKPDRRQLAATLGLTDAQVKVWFQNRRMKWRHSKEGKVSSGTVDEHNYLQVTSSTSGSCSPVLQPK